MLDDNDIKYIVELLADAINEKNWDLVYDAIDTLKEFQEDDDTYSSR